MSALRYAVLDENGVKINAILVADPFPADYWPGYGRFIVYEGASPAPAAPENVNIRPDFTYLLVTPSEQIDMGDTMDVQTGAVTKKPPPENVPEPAPDEVTE